MLAIKEFVRELIEILSRLLKFNFYALLDIVIDGALELLGAALDFL